MKNFVINLASRPERMMRMRSEAAALGLDLTRVEAETPETIDRSRFLDFVSSDPDWGLSLTEFACLSSHRKVWERVAAADEPYAVILEDDVVFASDAARFLTDDAWIPADADIVKLETRYTSVTRIVTVPSSRHARRALHRLTGRHMGCAAYILSKTAARRLLAMRLPPYTADEILFDNVVGLLGSLVEYQVVPAPCIQGDRLELSGAGVFGSSIVKDRRTMVIAYAHPLGLGPKPQFTKLLRERLGFPRWATARLFELERRMRHALLFVWFKARGQTYGPIPFDPGPAGPPPGSTDFDGRGP